MVPLRSFLSLGGAPLEAPAGAQELKEIEARVRGAGGEIVSLLKSGSAYYSPAGAALRMVESVLFDEKEVFAASVLCRGEYGLRDVFCGVPVVLGRAGIERVIEHQISAAEREALHQSADRVRRLIADF